MKHAFAMAVGLGVILLVSTASAVNWVTWHCPVPDPNPPPPTCDSLGKVHYTCSQGHFFTWPATVDADGDSLAPPTVECPACWYTNRTSPDSVLCHNDEWGPHRYYAPSWRGYNYYIP